MYKTLSIVHEERVVLRGSNPLGSFDTLKECLPADEKSTQLASSLHHQAGLDPAFSEIAARVLVHQGALGNVINLSHDGGFDCDDYFYLLATAALAKAGMGKFLAAISTLYPSEARASGAARLLHDAGFESVEHGHGPDISPKSFTNFEVKRVYKSESEGVATEASSPLILRLLTDAEPQSLTVSFTANFRNIHLFFTEDPSQTDTRKALFKEKVSRVVMMSGAIVNPVTGNVSPDGASNNSHDSEAATYFFAFLNQSKIPTLITTAPLATNSTLPFDFLRDLANVDGAHEFLDYIEGANKEFKAKFYLAVVDGFIPTRTVRSFLETFCTGNVIPDEIRPAVETHERWIADELAKKIDSADPSSHDVKAETNALKKSVPPELKQALKDFDVKPHLNAGYVLYDLMALAVLIPGGDGLLGIKSIPGTSFSITDTKDLATEEKRKAGLVELQKFLVRFMLLGSKRLEAIADLCSGERLPG